MIDQVVAMKDIVSALLKMQGTLGEKMYYDNDHEFAESTKPFGEAVEALLAAESHLYKTIESMKDEERR